MNGGASVGTPRLPFRQRYAPAAAALLAAAGGAVAAKKTVNRTMGENNISTLLWNEIAVVRSMVDEHGSDILNCVLRNKVPCDPGDPLKLGETDFLFTWVAYPSQGDPSLVAEAKKLFGSGDSWAGEYVDEGVQRFVDAKYSRGHDCGIMLGYVVVGPLLNAVKSVKVAMRSRKTRTQETVAFHPNNGICRHLNTHHSAHRQKSTNEEVTLVHLFIDLA